MQAHVQMCMHNIHMYRVRCIYSFFLEFLLSPLLQPLLCPLLTPLPPLLSLPSPPPHSLHHPHLQHDTICDHTGNLPLLMFLVPISSLGYIEDGYVKKEPYILSSQNSFVSFSFDSTHQTDPPRWLTKSCPGQPSIFFVQLWMCV